MDVSINSVIPVNTRLKAFGNKALKDFKINKQLYLLVLPVLVHYIIFQYGPMYGVIIAFKEFSPAKGILGSPWVGFKHLIDFFNSFFFGRTLKNTLVISLNTIIFGFPAPIILALLINEIRNRKFARVIQTITYMPHFISLVVICGMIREFTYDTGIINDFRALIGLERVSLLSKPGMFVPVYVASGIWMQVGWGSIIYLAALAGINSELYEAAIIDGAGRLKQTLHVTLPGIMPTVVILLILRIGHVMSVGFEKIILLYNPVIYETADVISTYVYRKGLLDFSWSYASAVGLFNTVINLTLLVCANKISRKVSEASLW